MYVTYFEIERDGSSGSHCCERETALAMMEHGDPRFACLLGVSDGTPTVVEMFRDSGLASDRREAIENAQCLFGE